MQPATSSPRARLTTALTGILLLGLAVPAWPQDNPWTRATLKGIKAVAVLVNMTSDTESGGLTKDQLRTDVELRLRKGGLRVVPLRSAETRWSVLVLTVDAIKADEFPVYGCIIVLEVHQRVFLMDEPGVPTVAPTWTQSFVCVYGSRRLRDGVRDGVADMVDKFINAYLEQNPKP